MLKRSVADELLELAARHGPREACGLLFGDETELASVVSEVVPLPNLSRSPHRFSMSRAAAASAREQRTSTHVAVFHTHESDAAPSRTDLKALRSAGVTWLICGPHELRAYSPDHHRRVIIIQEGRP